MVVWEKTCIWQSCALAFFISQEKPTAFWEKKPILAHCVGKYRVGRSLFSWIYRGSSFWQFFCFQEKPMVVWEKTYIHTFIGGFGIIGCRSLFVLGKTQGVIGKKTFLGKTSGSLGKTYECSWSWTKFKPCDRFTFRLVNSLKYASLLSMYTITIYNA